MDCEPEPWLNAMTQVLIRLNWLFATKLLVLVRDKSGWFGGRDRRGFRWWSGFEVVTTVIETRWER